MALPCTPRVASRSVAAVHGSTHKMPPLTPSNISGSHSALPLRGNTVLRAQQRDVQAQAVAEPPAMPAAKDMQLPRSAHGFELIREEYVEEYGSRIGVYKHQKTGAELMSVSNDDENKTFGAVFRTPVEDSTGIPHILEHSVLNGSRKYPVKEPFVELIKGSLNTFINAMTFPDRTCYPVASTNLQVRSLALSRFYTHVSPVQYLSPPQTRLSCCSATSLCVL
jgi:hypothetical protein